MSEFVYVPVEPTEEMLAATSWPNCAGTDYRHMLAAAPTQPSPAESDKESVRNAALEEVIALCEGFLADDYVPAGSKWVGESIIRGVRSIKSQKPAQPSDTEIPSLTTDRIANIVRDHLTAVYSCTRVWSAWSYGTMGQDDFVEASETELAEEIAEAIKAAMQADREGS